MTHPSPPLWIVSTGSHHRWKWLLWWTLSRTASPRSPSVWSVCSSDQPAHSCICHRRTPRPRQESISRAFFFFFPTSPEKNQRLVRAAQEGVKAWKLSSTSDLIAASNPDGFLVVVKDASVCLSCVAVKTLASSSHSLCRPSPNLCVQPQPSPSHSLLLPPPHTHTDTLTSFRLMTMTYLEPFLYVKSKCRTLLTP